VANTSAGIPAIGSDNPLTMESGDPPASQPPRSRVVDPTAEESALADVRAGRVDRAVKTLMNAYGLPLLGFALRLVRDLELAKDIRQQVFLEAFQGINQFEGRGSLWSWLCGITNHRCLDELRKRRRRQPLDDFDVLEGLPGDPDPLMDGERAGKRRALEQCLGKLPDALRSQLLMRCFLELSFVEIAELMEISQGTVQVRVSRVLPKLRRCLRGEGVAR
jgi:RNA polymerase sigma-70 factor (ECF subfamily)